MRGFAEAGENLACDTVGIFTSMQSCYRVSHFFIASACAVFDFPFVKSGVKPGVGCPCYYTRRTLSNLGKSKSAHWHVGTLAQCCQANQ